MPVKNFNTIETEDYRITPEQLIVKKAYIANGTSGQAIFDKNNIEGVIVETLPPNDIGLGGKKPVACFVFRITAAQLTTDEIGKKEAELKAKAEAEAKAQSEAAKGAAAAAPPPPAVMPTTQHPKDTDVVATGVTRAPGTLPK